MTATDGTDMITVAHSSACTRTGDLETYCELHSEASAHRPLVLLHEFLD
ncbi:hypothetical protein [Streptomyces sp. NBC_00557]|nr:hypothetical protein [Streptomyces sp. NBC_00557]WUC38655.1 hypothetical protein OG956_32700 [Streptomyces sp. NBC_00557]